MIKKRLVAATAMATLAPLTLAACGGGGSNDAGSESSASATVEQPDGAGLLHRRAGQVQHRRPAAEVRDLDRALPRWTTSRCRARH